MRMQVSVSTFAIPANPRWTYMGVVVADATRQAGIEPM